MLVPLSAWHLLLQRHDCGMSHGASSLCCRPVQSAKQQAQALRTWATTFWTADASLDSNAATAALPSSAPEADCSRCRVHADLASRSLVRA